MPHNRRSTTSHFRYPGYRVSLPADELGGPEWEPVLSSDSEDEDTSQEDSIDDNSIEDDGNIQQEEGEVRLFQHFIRLLFIHLQYQSEDATMPLDLRITETMDPSYSYYMSDQRELSPHVFNNVSPDEGRWRYGGLIWNHDWEYFNGRHYATRVFYREAFHINPLFRPMPPVMPFNMSTVMEFYIGDEGAFEIMVRITDNNFLRFFNSYE